MADKFPALDGVDLPNGDGEDAGAFLRREQEALGNEFAQPGDAAALDDDDEFSQFESQFPDVAAGDAAVENAAAAATENGVASPEPAPAPLFDDMTASAAVDYSGELEAMRQWKELRDLEIAQRDDAAAAKKEAIKAEAQKALDDFYENYNSKKDRGVQETRDAAQDFADERDKFLDGDSTVWDRVHLLVDEVHHGLGERDKTRFKQVLDKLKGNAAAPGAAGY